jgi:hypothetical protein
MPARMTALALLTFASPALADTLYLCEATKNNGTADTEITVQDIPSQHDYWWASFPDTQAELSIVRQLPLHQGPFEATLKAYTGHGVLGGYLGDGTTVLGQEFPASFQVSASGRDLLGRFRQVDVSCELL